MSTCNQLDLETLRSQPIVPQKKSQDIGWVLNGEFFSNQPASPRYETCD